MCHSGSPGNKKTTEVGETSIIAVEETANAILIMTGFIGFDPWYAILSLKFIRSSTWKHCAESKDKISEGFLQS